MLKHYLVAVCAAMFLLTAPAFAETPTTTNTDNAVASIAVDNTGTKANTVAAVGTDANTANTVTTEGTVTAGTVATGEVKPTEPKADDTFNAVGEGQEGQLSDEQMSQAIDAMIQAVGDGSGPLAFLVLFAMFFAGAIKKWVLPRLNIGKKWTPIVTMAASLVGALGYCGWAGLPLMEGMTTTAFAVASAVGGYEMVVKHLMALKSSAKDAKA